MNANLPSDSPVSLSPLPAGTATSPAQPPSTGQLPANIAPRSTTPIPGGNGMRPQQTGIPWPGIQLPQGHMPAPIQELLNAHLVALGQPPIGQTTPAAFPHGHSFAHTHNHASPWQHPPPFAQFPGFPPPNMHPVFAQQQQALIQQQQAYRAALSQQGISATPAPAAQNQGQAVIPANQLESVLGPSNGLPNRVGSPGISSTIVREGQGPNGAQWRVVINQSTTTLTPPGTNNQPPVALMAQPSSQHTDVQSVPIVSGEEVPLIQSSNTTESNATRQSANALLGRESYWPNSSLATVQQRLSQLERSLDQRTPPANGEIWQARIQLQNLRGQQPDLPPGLENSLNTRLNNISSRVAHMRTQVANSMTPTVNSASTILNVPAASSTDTTVYLLSSPSGPHALLVAPTGIYSTSVGSGMMSSHMTNRTPPVVDPAANQNPARAQMPRFNNEQEIRDIQDIQIIQGGGQHQQEQQAEQIGDLARILLPLGGHLWLLVRLFGFVYFFTSGAGWHRTILLCACAIVVFIGQTGVFRPIQQALWDPIRRHIEGLVPLAGNNGDNNGGVLNGQRPIVPLPTPQQVAERLLRERNDQNNGMVRRTARRIERATALFLASLVPGVGERHIAARDAADAARQAAEREREEQARRDEEIREQSEVVDGGNDSNETFVDMDEGVEPPYAITGQQPAVEI